MRRLNLRHLRAFLHVARSGGVSAASHEVFLSQPAITQALARMEATLGAPLFRRRSTGMFLTEPGELLFVRAGRALEFLAAGARRSARAAGRGRASGFQDFDRLLTMSQLRGFLALAKAGNYSRAARDLGVSRPSVHRSINDVERIAGFPMFGRTAHGYEPTAAGDIFRRAVLLAFSELRQGEEEIDLLLGRDTARLAIGSLPLARSFILPTVINLFTAARPQVRITVRDGAYGDLLHALRHGEIDVLVGALRAPAPDDEVEQEALYTDTLAIVGRAGHPLAGLPGPDASTLARFPWVAPSPGIPTRDQYDALFCAAGTEPPARLVETSSLVLIRGLLAGSDRLTIISRHQIAKDLRDGALAMIDFPVSGTQREIGIATRRGWVPTATQATFLETMRQVCSGLE